MLQNLIVFLIVIAAALYVSWRWLPAAWRRGAALNQTTGCGACRQCTNGRDGHLKSDSVHGSVYAAARQPVANECAGVLHPADVD
jgi:hypothetical protein